MEESIKTGWERENRTHFNEITEKYDKARWDYPDILYDDIFKYVGYETSKKAIEIGPGTGKSTKPFLEAGYDITAVELSQNMADYIQEKFSKFHNLSIIISSFEDTVLNSNSYDLVYAASAFHWVTPEIGCPKVFNYLKDNGVFALFRNNAKPKYYDNLFHKIQKEYDKYFNKGINSKIIFTVDEHIENYKKPIEIFKNFGFENMSQFGFNDIVMKFYCVDKAYTPDEYIALLDTMADHRNLSENNRNSLYTGIKEAIKNNGGLYWINNIYQLYMGRKT
jgi:ubiquinone/menaquinone biosynthesis C-methylase UbiE